MFNYLHKKFYTKYGHVLAAIFISLPTYLKHSEPEKSNKPKIQYWKQKWKHSNANANIVEDGGHLQDFVNQSSVLINAMQTIKKRN